jgi:hypothetical protein
MQKQKCFKGIHHLGNVSPSNQWLGSRERKTYMLHVATDKHIAKICLLKGWRRTYPLTKPDLLSNATSQNLSISSCLWSSKLNCSNSNTSSLLSATQVDRWSKVPTTRNHTILEYWHRWNTQQTASANIACCNRDPHEYNNLEKRSFVNCSYSSYLRKLFWKPQMGQANEALDKLHSVKQ